MVKKILYSINVAPEGVPRYFGGGGTRCRKMLSMYRDAFTELGYEVEYLYVNPQILPPPNVLTPEEFIEKTLDAVSRSGFYMPERWFKKCVLNYLKLKRIKRLNFLFFGEAGELALDAAFSDYCTREYIREVNDIDLHIECQSERPSNIRKQYVLKRSMGVKNIAIVQSPVFLFPKEWNCSPTSCFMELYSPYAHILKRNGLCCWRGYLNFLHPLILSSLPTQKKIEVSSIDLAISISPIILTHSVFAKFIPDRTIFLKWANPISFTHTGRWIGGEGLLIAAGNLLIKGLIDALIVAKKLGVPIKVIGNAGPLKPLIEKFKSKGVKVEYLGLLPRQELFEHMRRADVFIYPSYLDAYPLTLAEAVSIGVPVVTYKNPAYSWIYKDVLPLVKLGNVNKLTEVTAKVLQDPSCVLDNYEKWNVPEFAKSWDSVLRREVEVIKKWLSSAS